MSLLSEAMEPCVFMNKSKESDGYGGYVDTYTDGVSFDAAITYDTSIQARVAEQQGVKNIYTVTTRKNMTLNNRDVFRRESDNKYFRVTSDGDDHKTPNSATLDMRVVTAEEFKISG